MACNDEPSRYNIHGKQIIFIYKSKGESSNDPECYRKMLQINTRFNKKKNKEHLLLFLSNMYCTGAKKSPAGLAINSYICQKALTHPKLWGWPKTFLYNGLLKSHVQSFANA